MQKENIIVSKFADILGKSECDLTDLQKPISDFGLDSLSLFDLILELEDELDITIPIEELDTKLSINDILILANKD